jgi:hypothetical protein
VQTLRNTIPTNNKRKQSRKWIHFNDDFLEELCSMINMDNSDIDVCVNNVANTISDKMVQAAGSTFGYKTFSTKKTNC